MQGSSDGLLTGATGFVGMELLMRYLEQTDRTVLTLVRAQDHHTARDRIAGVLRMMLGDAEAHRDRVIPIPGDLERDGLGLSDADRERITARAGEVVHWAAKYEAEQLVRADAQERPAVNILRPSIIVGESATGWTPAFNALYVPLRAFAQHRLRVLPADPAAPVDLVPVDHVADAIVHVERESESGVNTHRLVAGDRASTVAELVALSARHLHRRPPPLVPAAAYRAAYPLLLAGSGRRRRAALRRTAPFLPYHTMRVRCCRERAARVLDPAGLRPPRLETYYDRLVDWALATNWSRQPQPRPGSAYARVRMRTDEIAGRPRS